MAVPQPSSPTARQTRRSKVDSPKPTNEGMSNTELALEHLPPLPLVFVILLCSGALFVLALRDFWLTGLSLGHSWDNAMLAFTRSTQWFDDAKGWKSTQGGFSAIQQVTTDHNNMGGFFVRKLAGAAAAGVHLQKLMPVLFHPTGAQWTRGHFQPMLVTALLANAMIAGFYGFYLEDLASAGAGDLPTAILAMLFIESLVILAYLVSVSRNRKRGLAIAMTDGKTPTSVVSRIVTRTVGLVSLAMTVIAVRDLFFPGFILDFVPRDDIYLEWTNALIHSPPEGSPEAQDHGLEAPLYIGDKFMSQYMGLHVLILCLYKFVSAFLIRYKSDGSGEVESRMIWKASAVGGAMMLFVVRVFTPAAKSASLDMRWHLMCMAYETFILGVYGCF